MTKIESVSAAILRCLADDFAARDLSASDLQSGYEGVAIKDLKSECVDASPVDFDLAFDAMAEKKFIRTGPMVPYENRPGSTLVMMGLYSKKEWASLSVTGSQQAQKIPHQPASREGNRVHISGGTFVNSPLGVGSNIQQSSVVGAPSQSEIFERLLALAREASAEDHPGIEDDVRELVGLAEAGDLAKAKPLYQKLFSFAASGAQQVAWGIVSSLITAQMGIPTSPP